MRKLKALIAPALVAALGLGISATVSAADAAAGKAKAGVCAGCHGINGHSAQPIWPNLAGQGAKYLSTQLKAFKAGQRTGPNAAQMTPMVATLTPEDMDNLGAYFASLAPAQGKADAAVAAAGEKLYRGGDTALGIPACMSCHGPDGKGMAAAGFPAVAGQHAQYSMAQLQAFASGARTGGQSALMLDTAKKLSPEAMRAVSEYMAGLR